MRIFTKRTHIIGVTRSEFDALMQMASKAQSSPSHQADIQIGPQEWLGIEISEAHSYRPRSKERP